MWVLPCSSIREDKKSRTWARKWCIEQMLLCSLHCTTTQTDIQWESERRRYGTTCCSILTVAYRPPRIGYRVLWSSNWEEALRAGTTHIRDKLQKPAKNYFRKIREIEWSYLCLQQFDKFWMWHCAATKTYLTLKLVRSGCYSIYLLMLNLLVFCLLALFLPKRI